MASVVSLPVTTLTGLVSRASYPRSLIEQASLESVGGGVGAADSGIGEAIRRAPSVRVIASTILARRRSARRRLATSTDSTDRDETKLSGEHIVADVLLLAFGDE